MDSSKFKKLVREIKNWVDYLWDILSQRENLKMMQAMDSMLTQIIALSDKVSGLQALEKALVNNLGSTQTEPILASAAHLRMTVLNDPEMNRDTIVSSRESAAVTPPYSIEELSMDEITEFVRMDNYPNVGMAKYHGESVFVEYAVYTNLDVWRFDEVLVRRAKNVAKFLNAEKHSAFRLLRCKGIAVQNKGLTAWRTKGGKGTIAFVHSIPDPFHSYPVSLPRLLETGGTSPPSVTTRLSIALRLLQGVKYTHTTGWLHRNIRSENIVFFVNQGAALRTGDCSVIPKPTLVGFAFARLDEVLLSIGPAPSYPPTDIYQHPFYIGEGYSRYAPYMDVYSLGTVLVELAEWKPLSDLVSTVIDVWKNPVVGNAEDVRGFLVDAASSGHGLQLQFRMGDVFARIVQLCLSANSDRQIPYGPTSSDEDKRSEVERALELLGKAVNELEKCWI